MDRNVRDFLSKKGISLKTPLVVISDKRIIHSIRDVKRKRDASLSLDEIKLFPQVLDSPEAILFDKDKKNILYVFSGTDDRKNKIVIEINYNLKKVTEKIQELYKNFSGKNVNIIITAGKVAKFNLLDNIRYELIKGKIK